MASHIESANVELIAEYPRALEWLGMLQTSLVGLTSPTSDPSKVSDAATALDMVQAAIDGPNNDGVPSAGCSSDLQTVNAGTATPAQVLAGQTFSSSTGVGLSGTMPDNGAVVLTPGTSNQTIPAAYHNGAGYCAGDPNLTANNIITGATIFGVAGAYRDEYIVSDSPSPWHTKTAMLTARAYLTSSVVNGTI